MFLNTSSFLSLDYSIATSYHSIVFHGQNRSFSIWIQGVVFSLTMLCVVEKVERLNVSERAKGEIEAIVEEAIRPLKKKKSDLELHESKDGDFCSSIHNYWRMNADNFSLVFKSKNKILQSTNCGR